MMNLMNHCILYVVYRRTWTWTTYYFHSFILVSFDARALQIVYLFDKHSLVLQTSQNGT